MHVHVEYGKCQISPPASKHCCVIQPKSDRGILSQNDYLLSSYLDLKKNVI